MNDTISTPSHPSDLPTIDPVSGRVVSAVADAEGVSELDLPPLARTIDPDALNALIESIAESPGSTGHVEFTYAGHAVTVTADQQVDVRPRSA